jgi:hypothetical protein
VTRHCVGGCTHRHASLDVRHSAGGCSFAHGVLLLRGRHRLYAAFAPCSYWCRAT